MLGARATDGPEEIEGDEYGAIDDEASTYSVRLAKRNGAWPNNIQFVNYLTPLLNLSSTKSAS